MCTIRLVQDIATAWAPFRAKKKFFFGLNCYCLMVSFPGISWKRELNDSCHLPAQMWLHLPFLFWPFDKKMCSWIGSIVLVSCNHLFGRSWLQFGVHLNLLSHERSKGSMKYLCTQLAGQEGAVQCCNPVNMNVINTQLNGSRLCKHSKNS